MSHFNRYVGVPPGSTVEVEIDPCDGKAARKAKLISASDVETWDPCAAQTPRHKLAAGRNYFVSVRFAFIATGTLRVRITVRSPAGEVHSSPWGWSIAGDNGEVALVGGFIQVA